MTDEEVKSDVLYTIKSYSSKFLYYDRKGDDEVTIKVIDRAIKDRLVTVEDIVESFKKQLIEDIKINYGDEYAYTFPQLKKEEVEYEHNVYVLESLTEPGKYYPSKGWRDAELKKARIYPREGTVKGMCTRQTRNNIPKYKVVKFGLTK